MSGLIFGKSESVRADDCAVLEGDMVPQGTALAYNRVGMGKEMASDPDSRIEDDVRQDGGVRTQADTGANHYVGADVSSHGDLGGGVDNGCRVDARSVGGWLIKQAERPGKSQVWVFDAQRCGRNFGEFGFHENGGSVCFSGQTSVTGISNKGDLGGTCLLNSFHTCDFQFRVAV